LMDGYFGQPERTADTLVDGWLDTGDRAFVHEGELYIVGRDKDVLIVRGRNIAPTSIEDLVDRVPGVRTGCVAAVPVSLEDGATEGIRLFVERRKDATVEEQEALSEACKEVVVAALGVLLDDVVVLAAGTLPRTSSGKIRRAAERARWEAGTLLPPARVTALNMLGVTCRSALAHRRAKGSSG
jgi:fatty-acyl-CoA synthase